jgi:hypothetical protein
VSAGRAGLTRLSARLTASRDTTALAHKYVRGQDCRLRADRLWSGDRRMLKHLATLFVALLIVLIAFAWAESYSSSFQNCINSGLTKAAEQGSKNQNSSVIAVVRDYVRCTERFADTHNALITALATVLLSAITFGLILSGVDQQNTSRAQLRAYVFVDNAEITHIEDGAGVPEGHVFIKNFGQTPAYKVTSVAGFAISVHPPPQNLNLTITEAELDRANTRSDMGPGQRELAIASPRPRLERALTD